MRLHSGEIAGEKNAVAVGNLAADPGFADGDVAVAGDELEKLVLALDLEFVEPRQQ
jgi:hypothetical protein